VRKVDHWHCDVLQTLQTKAFVLLHNHLPSGIVKLHYLGGTPCGLAQDNNSVDKLVSLLAGDFVVRALFIIFRHLFLFSKYSDRIEKLQTFCKRLHRWVCHDLGTVRHPHSLSDIFLAFYKFCSVLAFGLVLCFEKLKLSSFPQWFFNQSYWIQKIFEIMKGSNSLGWCCVRSANRTNLHLNRTYESI
jgi:hypothetical protein